MKTGEKFAIQAVSGKGFVPALSGVPGGWTYSCPESGQGAVDPVISVSDGRLCLSWNGESIHLASSVQNGEPGSGTGTVASIAMAVQEGVFSLFDTRSQVAVVAEDEQCKAVRVTTPLELGNVRANTDLWLWRGVKLITVVTYFEADRCVMARLPRLCEVSADQPGVSVWVNGAWKACDGESVCGMELSRSWDSTWDDLRACGAERPFVTYIAYGGQKPRVPVFEFAPAASPEKVRVIESGDLRLTLRDGGDGMGLYSVQDLKAGNVLTSASIAPLFRLVLRELEGTGEHIVDSLSGWGTVRKMDGEERVDILFDGYQDKALHGVSILLTAVCDAAISRVSWKIDVRCRNDALTVVRMDPPMLCADAADDMRAFLSLDSGVSLPFSAGHEVRYQCE